MPEVVTVIGMTVLPSRQKGSLLLLAELMLLANFPAAYMRVGGGWIVPESIKGETLDFSV